MKREKNQRFHAGFSLRHPFVLPLSFLTGTATVTGLRLAIIQIGAAEPPGMGKGRPERIAAVGRIEAAAAIQITAGLQLVFMLPAATAGSTAISLFATATAAGRIVVRVMMIVVVTAAHFLRKRCRTAGTAFRHKKFPPCWVIAHPMPERGKMRLSPGSATPFNPFCRQAGIYYQIRVPDHDLVSLF